MRISLQLTLLVLSIAAIGCASSRKAVHPLAGEWSYQVPTDERTYTGVLSLRMADESLQGTLRGQGLETPAPLRDVKYEAPMLTFETTSPEHGTLNVTLTFDGDSFSGEMWIPRYGSRIPMTGTRVTTP